MMDSIDNVDNNNILDRDAKRHSSDDILPYDSSSQNASANSVSPPVFYVLAFIFGVSCLIPWNSFITASDYFLNRIKENSKLAIIFSSTLSISNMVPLLASFFINTLFLYKYQFKIRILTSLSIVFMGFVLITCLIPVDIGLYHTTYFSVIMLTSAVLGSCSSFAQSAFYALAAYFDCKFINYFITGQAFAGLIISIIKVIIISCQFTEVTSTGIYFGCSLFSVLISIIGYILCERSAFFKKAILAHSNIDKHLETTTESDYNKSQKYVKNTFKQSFDKYIKIYKKIHIPANSLFVLCFTTLFIFPGLVLQVKSTQENTVWAEKFFSTVYCFLMFSLGDTVSRFAIGFFRWPKPNSIVMLILCLARFAFLPLFLLCHRTGDNLVIASQFYHDVIPILIMLLFSFSNGYFMVLAFDSAPRLVDQSEHELCNTLMSLSLGLGLTAGSFSSYIVTYISSMI